MATVRVTKEGLDITVEVPEDLADQIIRMMVTRSTSSKNPAEKRGKRPTLTAEQQAQVIELAKVGKDYTAIANELNTSYWTVRRYLKAEGF